MRVRVFLFVAAIGLVGLGFVIFRMTSTVSVPGIGQLAVQELSDLVQAKLGQRRLWWSVERNPLVVRRLAWPAASAYADEGDRSSYVSGFGDGFKSALTDPDAKVTRWGDAKDAGVIGFKAGRAAALSGSAAAKKISLRDYGYKEVTRTGTVSLKLEMCHFIPRAENDIWWINLTSRQQYEKLTPLGRRDRGTARETGPVIATVKGFLSPPKTPLGGYGHMGGCAREIVVTEVIEAHRAAPAGQ